MANVGSRLSHRATPSRDAESRREPLPAPVPRVQATQPRASPPSRDIYQGRRRSIAQGPSSDHPVEAYIGASSESTNTEGICTLLLTRSPAGTGGMEACIFVHINGSHLVGVARLTPQPRLSLDLNTIGNRSGLSSADETPAVEAQQRFRDDIDIRPSAPSPAFDLEQWYWGR